MRIRECHKSDFNKSQVRFVSFIIISKTAVKNEISILQFLLRFIQEVALTNSNHVCIYVFCIKRILVSFTQGPIKALLLFYVNFIIKIRLFIISMFSAVYFNILYVRYIYFYAKIFLHLLHLTSDEVMVYYKCKNCNHNNINNNIFHVFVRFFLFLYNFFIISFTFAFVIFNKT